MGALRQAWANILRYLGQLQGRDRVLIGSLVVSAALVLALLAIWSSKPAMVPLMPEMGAEANAAAMEALKLGDIEYEPRDGKVYVRPDKQAAALAYLQQTGRMPENTQSLFAALIKSQNWMASKSQNDQLANAALCDVLGKVISNFKGVESATVMIDAPDGVGFASNYRKPTASVGVTLKSGRQMDRELVDAIAALVAGARAGLSTEAVKVVDLKNGRQFTAKIASDYGASDYLESVAKQEERLQKKVAEMVMAFDPYAIVVASMQVEPTAKQTTTDKVLPDRQGSLMVEVESTTETTTSSSGNPAAAGAAAPGVSSNVSADVTNGGNGTVGGGNGSNSEKTTTKTKPEIGREKTVSSTPSGIPRKASVLISLSREYIAGLFKVQKAAPAAASGGSGGGSGNAPAEPTQAEIETIFAKEKQRIEKDLSPQIEAMLLADAASTAKTGLQAVTVSLIPVPRSGPMMAAMGLPTASISAGGSGGGGGLMSQLLSGGMVKTAFLGLLAVASLGMMVMLVKKSSKAQNLPTAEEVAGLPPIIEPEDDVVGEADEGAMAMEGIELDDAQLKTKKMLESIGEMVKKNPQDAAAMLSRWINVER